MIVWNVAVSTFSVAPRFPVMSSTIFSCESDMRRVKQASYCGRKRISSTLFDHRWMKDEVPSGDVEMAFMPDKS